MDLLLASARVEMASMMCSVFAQRHLLRKVYQLAKTIQIPEHVSKDLLRNNVSAQKTDWLNNLCQNA